MIGGARGSASSEPAIDDLSVKKNNKKSNVNSLKSYNVSEASNELMEFILLSVSSFADPQDRTSCLCMRTYHNTHVDIHSPNVYHIALL